jgi:hypothetical protein
MLWYAFLGKSLALFSRGHPTAFGNGYKMNTIPSCYGNRIIGKSFFNLSEGAGHPVTMAHSSAVLQEGCQQSTGSAGGIGHSKALLLDSIG